jgi:hypothetical protein
MSGHAFQVRSEAVAPAFVRNASPQAKTAAVDPPEGTTGGRKRGGKPDPLQLALNKAPRVQAMTQLKRALNRAGNAGQVARLSSVLQQTSGGFLQKKSIPGQRPSATSIQQPIADGVAQRLKVEGTKWTKVRSITSSAAGAGGVLFMSDGGDDRLVVKPGIPGDEEMAAAHAHAAVSDIGGGLGKWKIKALGSRMATPHDVAGIRVARQRVELNGALSARTAGLLDAVAAGTTLIQEAAAGGSSSMTDQMLEQSPDKHILPGAARTGSSKDKVKAGSPLKPLMKGTTNFARSLGRLAATDLVLGNFDRIVETANLENLLLNKDKKLVHPIDNTGGAATARLLAGGGGPVAKPAWTNHYLVAMFIAHNYAGIAADVWAIGGTAMRTFSDDLLTGFIGPVATRRYNVDPSERASVQTKLGNHLVDIQTAFAEGLLSGRDELVRTGGIPVASGVSQAARDQYAARLAKI